jgi:TFIIF-interacting CTD phosphatase-like protein
MTVLLRGKSLNPPAQALDFLDESWQELGEAKTRRTSLKTMEKIFNKNIVDEQDASTDEIIMNMYLYALSDFCLYAETKDFNSLTACKGSIIDFYDYVSSQKYAREQKEGRSFVCSDTDEAAIRSSSEYLKEMKSLEADIAFAKINTNWSSVALYRFRSGQAASTGCAI